MILALYMMVGVIFSDANMICQSRKADFNTYDLREKLGSYILGFAAWPIYIPLLYAAHKIEKGGDK